jgi:phenylacetate-coenzyme A ligase PaaK-like adenylate-forming protein
MRIHNPQREAETAWMFGNSLNRVDIEAAVFQPENLDFLTGEYEAFIHYGDTTNKVSLHISVECLDTEFCNRNLVTDNIIGRFLRYKPLISQQYHEGNLDISVTFAAPGGLELSRQKGRPKRLIDRRVTV